MTGGIALAAGGGAALALPLAWALASSSCDLVFGSCGDGSLPEGMLAAMGTGLVAAVAGLVMLVSGVGERDRARAARRPLVDRVERERRELEWLESIDVLIGDQAASVMLRASF